MNIKELAEQAGIDQYDFGYMDITKDELDKFAELVENAVRKDEREECAKQQKTNAITTKLIVVLM